MAFRISSAKRDGRGRRAPSPRPWRTARTGARCRLSPSIRPTPRTMTTRFMPSLTPRRKTPDGVIVTVAIADVSWYIAHRLAARHREALKRGNSVYFPDRVVPMLPERISNDLCSLREGVDRPALAVRMIVLPRKAARPAIPSTAIMMKSARKALLPAGPGRDRRQARRQDRTAARDRS